MKIFWQPPSTKDPKTLGPSSFPGEDTHEMATAKHQRPEDRRTQLVPSSNPGNVQGQRPPGVLDRWGTGPCCVPERHADIQGKKRNRFARRTGTTGRASARGRNGRVHVPKGARWPPTVIN